MIQTVNIDFFNIAILRKDTTNKSSENLRVFHNKLRCVYKTNTIMQIIHTAVVVVYENNAAICAFACFICHCNEFLCFTFTFFACKNLNHRNLPLHDVGDIPFRIC